MTDVPYDGLHRQLALVTRQLHSRARHISSESEPGQAFSVLVFCRGVRSVFNQNSICIRARARLFSARTR